MFSRTGDDRVVGRTLTLDPRQFDLTMDKPANLAPYPLVATCNFFSIQNELVGRLTIATEGSAPSVVPIHSINPITISTQLGSFSILISNVDYEHKTAKILVSKL